MCGRGTLATLFARLFYGDVRQMTDPNHAACYREEVRWRDDRSQDVVPSWHPPGLPAPDGKPRSSAGICFTPERNVVLVTGR